MKSREFLQSLRNLIKNGWSVYNTKEIRLIPPPNSNCYYIFCPLSAIYFEKTGKKIDNREFLERDVFPSLERFLRDKIIRCVDDECKTWDDFYFRNKILQILMEEYDE